MCFPDTKCRNERHLAAVFYSKTGAFEVIHGLLDRLMQMLAIPYIGAGKEGEMTRLMQMLAIPHIGAGKECGAMTKNGYQIRQKDGKTIFKLNFLSIFRPNFLQWPLRGSAVRWQASWHFWRAPSRGAHQVWAGQSMFCAGDQH